MAIDVVYLALVILYTSSTLAQTASQDSQSSTYNSCCQGPAGIPAVPGTAGIPGNNSLPGRDGIKGEDGTKGDIGPDGQSGPPGPQGPRGERGERGPQGLQGLPGKLGPSGLDSTQGGVGPTGPRGGKGEKGENGATRGATNTQRSAFSVAKTASQTGSANAVLTFDVVYKNTNGHFDTNSNKFTCQIPGTYLFFFTIAGHKAQNPYMKLVKNDVTIVSTYKYDYGQGQLEQSSNSVIIPLVTGDQVWIKFGTSSRQVYSDGDRYTSFLGYLLYED